MSCNIKLFHVRFGSVHYVNGAGRVRVFVRGCLNLILRAIFHSFLVNRVLVVACANSPFVTANNFNETPTFSTEISHLIL